MEKRLNLNNNWRKVAATIYKKPSDSKIYGSVDLDVTDLEAYITEKRKQKLKITLTHIFVLAVARALDKQVPELNTYIKRGKVVARKSIDAMVSVLLKEGQMGSVKIGDANSLDLKGLSLKMQEEIKRSRQGDENQTMQSKDMLSSIPWPFRSWLFRLYKLVTIHWGISIPFVGLNADSFGSFVISNIGSIGLDSGYPALLPSSNVSIVLIMGGVYKKPAVFNDEIVPRKIMSLSTVLDHRVVDASHGGKLFRAIKHYIKNPWELEEPAG